MRPGLLVVADVELQIMIHYDQCDKVFGSKIVSRFLLQMLMQMQTMHPENNDSERQNIVTNILWKINGSFDFLDLHLCDSVPTLLFIHRLSLIYFKKKTTTTTTLSSILLKYE